MYPSIQIQFASIKQIQIPDFYLSLEQISLILLVSLIGAITFFIYESEPFE